MACCIQRINDGALADHQHRIINQLVDDLVVNVGKSRLGRIDLDVHDVLKCRLVFDIKPIVKLDIQHPGCIGELSIIGGLNDQVCERITRIDDDGMFAIGR